MKTQNLEKVEYTMGYVVYSSPEKEDYDWVDEFDTKKGAKVFAKENFSNPKIRVCASIDAQLCGNEFAYGDTKAEAINNLKAQVKEYGYLPYTPYE